MDFKYSDEQLQLKEEVSTFASKESETLSEEYEEESIFPRDLFQRMADKGWVGVMVPQNYGGMGKGAIEYSIIMEELSKQLLLNPQQSIQVIKALLASGTEEQKSLYLPKLASGEYVSAMAISEPQTASTFKTLRTTARKEGDFYVVNGRKKHINLAKEADIFILLVRTDMGLTNLIVEKNTPGLRFEKSDPISGRTAPVYEVFLSECKIPEKQLLGTEGKGMDTFFAIFNLSRIGNASQLIGWARGCLEDAVKYATGRKIGDNFVTDFQGIQWTLAELVAEIEACRVLRDRAAWAEDQNIEHTLDTSIAKLMAGRVAEKVVNQCFSLVGGYSCYRAAPFERYWCAIKMGQVAGGSTEILKNTMARQILKEYKF